MDRQAKLEIGAAGAESRVAEVFDLNTGLIAVGGMLSVLLKGIKEKFAFTRLSLIMALTPLSLISFMDQANCSTLYLFSMIVELLGITVDGINYLLLPKERQRPAEKVEEQAPTAAEPDSGVIIWEKAE